MRPGRCPRCYLSPRTPHDLQAAIRGALAPHELAHLIRWSPPGTARTSFVENAARGIQQQIDRGALRYIPDPDPFELVCSPAMMLRRGGGDCDDFAVYAASLLRAGGLQAHVVVGAVCFGVLCSGHAWCEGTDELGRWFLLDATAPRVRLHYRAQPHYVTAWTVGDPLVELVRELERERRQRDEWRRAAAGEMFLAAWKNATAERRLGL